MNRGPSDDDRVRALREVLTATGAGIYLSTHVAGPIPAETLVAVHESDDMELRIGRAGADRDDDLEQREKEARAVAAAAIKGSPERVVLMHGLAEAATAIALEILGQRAEATASHASRVLLVEGLDPSILASIESVARASAVRVEIVSAAPQIIAADVAFVAMAHIDATGRVAEIARTGEAARKAGARLLVDASLSVGAIPVEVATFGADVVIAATHRWLLGPEAVTLAWLSPEMGAGATARLRSAVGPFGRGALLALARSVGWLLMYVELPWVLARTGQLAGRLYDALDAIDGIELLTPRDRHAALASFRIRGWDAVQAAEELSRSVFVILDTDAERDAVRASVGAWNREDELDRFMERVAELASHTPETLTRKPSLTVLSGSGRLDDE